jgi:hypothetical protein
MADHKIAGGSSNLKLVLNSDSEENRFEFSGLDANGQVLLSINATLFAGTSGAEKVYISLPSIASLNFRKVTFTLNTGDYAGTVFFYTQPDNFFNGLDLSDTPIQFNAIAGITGQVTVGSNNSWTQGRILFNS